MTSTSRPEPSPTVLRAKDPADLIAAVPYLLGFHPSDSLVALSVHGPRRRIGFSLRMDLLPEQHADAVAERLVGALQANDAAQVLLLAYATDAERARPLVEAMRTRLADAGVEVVEAMRVDGARWYSYTCTKDCCPPEGRPYDIGSSEVAAHAVMSGEVAMASRDELVASVAPVRGPAQRAMTQATESAQTALAGRVQQLGTEHALTRLAAELETFVTDYVERPRRLRDADIAWLSVAVFSISVRDHAWVLMTRPQAREHLDLWQQVLRRVQPPYEPAVACLAGFAAWLTGSGVLASAAIERALDADPSYSWAHLLQETLDRALPPSVWDGMGPELRTKLAG